VYAAIPGVGGDFESKGVTDPLMEVDTGLRPYVHFYEKFLGVSSTDTYPVRQRRYSALTPVTVAALRVLAP
jgi:hypothetical protein